MARTILGQSRATQQGAHLALAPALTPAGVEAAPTFFSGFATYPRALAQGLITLADITSTRYYKPVPTDLCDPVLTAHGDRLRAEVFSADNGVYARLDLDQSGVDGGNIAHGTTNVDIGPQMRKSLALIRDTELFHLEIGHEGFTASTPQRTKIERPVKMPDRWVRAFGNAAELHRSLQPKFSVVGNQATMFIATLPAVSASDRSGWLTPTPTGVKISDRPTPDAVWVDGLNRLSGLKRLMILVDELVFYGPADSAPGLSAVKASIPGASLTLALTEEVYRGYSGEGSLLQALASPEAAEDATLINAALNFEPRIDVTSLQRSLNLPEERIRHGLAILASSGRVGWDFSEEKYFHRELPDDPDRIEKDNPRLVRAQAILAAGGVQLRDENSWNVDGGNSTHRVSRLDDGWQCTCPWALRYGTRRGLCAHILAVTMLEG